MFKNTQFCALLLALCVLGQAEAATFITPGKHSHSSHSTSFGSFNASSKKASTDSVAPSGNGFGAFGSSTATTNTFSTNKSSSVLSKNLEQNQAQQNALNNFDARNPQRSAASSFAPQPTINQPNYATTTTVTQPLINQTVIVHDRGSSGWGNNLMWFWLGQSSERHPNNNVYVNGAYPSANQVVTTDSVTGTTTADNQEPGTQPSGTPWLVVVIWLLIGSAVLGLVVSHFMHAKQNAKPPNYSL